MDPYTPRKAKKKNTSGRRDCCANPEKFNGIFSPQLFNLVLVFPSCLALEINVCVFCVLPSGTRTYAYMICACFSCRGKREGQNSMKIDDHTQCVFFTLRRGYTFIVNLYGGFNRGV